MTDKISIHQLRVEMSIGAYEWERSIRQTVYVDVTLFSDTSTAGNSDQLSDAVDYSKVAEAVTQTSLKKHYDLIEAFAEDIAASLLIGQCASEVEIIVTKPGAVQGAKAVSVAISRSV